MRRYVIDVKTCQVRYVTNLHAATFHELAI